MRSKEDSFCSLSLEVSRIDEAFDEDEAADEGDVTDKSTISGELPSIGSVEHESGTCKRCNFFAKGRCQNDRNCRFCHFSHNKRKPSRQEKRERRAAWMIEQGNVSKTSASEASEVTDDAEGGAEEGQPTVMYSMLPGLPPVVSGATLPGPLALPGVAATTGSAIPAPYPCGVPPGLSPPRRQRQASAPVIPGILSTVPFAADTEEEDDSPAAAMTPAAKRMSTVSTQTSPQPQPEADKLVEA